MRDLIAFGDARGGRRLGRAGRPAAHLRRAQRAWRAGSRPRCSSSASSPATGSRCSSANNDRLGRACSGRARGSARRACRSTRGGRPRSSSSRCATPAPRCCSATRSAGPIVRDIVDDDPDARARLRDRTSMTPDGRGPPGRSSCCARRRSGRAARTWRSTRTTCSRSSTRRARPGKPKGATITHRQALANLHEPRVLGAVAAAQGSGEQRSRASGRGAARRAAVPRDRHAARR